MYCDKKGIIFEAYSPLGCPARPMKADDDPSDMDDPVIKEIAEKHNASPAQICISFALHRGLMVIPKTVNPKRIIENYNSTKLKLSEEDMARLTAIDKDYRLFKGEGLFNKKEVPWQETWDVESDAQYEV